MTQIFLLTFAGALIYEGLAWAVGPSAMRRMYDQAMQQLGDRQLSNAGLISVVIGVGFILLALQLPS